MTRRATHRMSRTRLYRIWCDMHGRCSKTTYSAYEYYGGRGIRVGAEWAQFEPFRDWALSHGYDDNLTIDRINTDGNYVPENCTWATRKQQVRNQRRNVWVELWGERKLLVDWLKDSRVEVGSGGLYSRINRRGWSLEEALSTPKLGRTGSKKTKQEMA